MNDAERVSRRWFEEGWNAGDEGVFRELAASEVEAVLATGTIDDLETFLEFRRELLAALPDLEVTVEDVLSGEGRTAVLWRLRAHHTGQGFGLAPTGKEVDVRGTTWQRVRDGKVVSGIDCWDLGGLLDRLRSEAGG